MSGPRTKIFRRRFFVKKEFQGKFILLYALTVTLVALLATLLLNSRLNEEVNRLFFSSHLRVDSTAGFVRQALLQVNLLVLLLLVAGITLLSLYVFRRLNSHFSQIENLFEAMAEGRYDSAALEPSRFNEVSHLIGLAEQVRDACGERAGRLSRLAADLDRALAEGAGEDELSRIRLDLEEILSEVRLPES